MTDLREWIRAQARARGIAEVGFARAEPSAEETARLEAWLAAGHHGTMGWMARDVARRADVRRSMPEARTVLVAACPYDAEEPRTADALEVESGGARGWISRYAWGDDYHDWVRERLEQLVADLREHVVHELAARVYVDTGPVMEKALAARAGLGWIGKNACLLSPSLGSFVYLGVALLSLEIEPDSPGRDRCGTCRACLEVCPTEAFPAPYVLDARRCISYLTIEHRGDVEPALEASMGPHVFGCDLCQDVCPWTRKSPRAADREAEPRAGLVAPALAELAGLDEATFRERFRRSPVKRAKLSGLRRNVAIALGNVGGDEADGALARLAADPDATVAAAARRSAERRRDRGE